MSNNPLYAHSWIQPTGKGKADMIVQHGNLPDSTGILQLQHGLLLHAQYDNVLAADADLREMSGNRTRMRIQHDIPRMSPCARPPMHIRPVAQWLSGSTPRAMFGKVRTWNRCPSGEKTVRAVATYQTCRGTEI